MPPSRQNSEARSPDIGARVVLLQEAALAAYGPFRFRPPLRAFLGFPSRSGGGFSLSNAAMISSSSTGTCGIMASEYGRFAFTIVASARFRASDSVDRW